MIISDVAIINFGGGGGGVSPGDLGRRLISAVGYKTAKGNKNKTKM